MGGNREVDPTHLATLDLMSEVLEQLERHEEAAEVHERIQQLKSEEREKAVAEFLSRLEEVRVGGGEVQGGASCPEGHLKW